MPMAPAPTMTIEPGRSRSRICSSNDTTFFESSMPGSERTTEPVEMITWSAVTRSTEPSAFVTSIDFASTKDPRPSYSVTLFFFIRKWMPLTWVSDTLRLRSNAAPKSKVTSPEIPKKSAL